MSEDKENYKRYMKDQTYFNISGSWRQGPSISFSDLKNNEGNIEYISSINESAIQKTKPKNDKNKINSSLMNFGKYKNQTIEWVIENDEEYFSWCLENIPSFEKRVKLL